MNRGKKLLFFSMLAVINPNVVFGMHTETPEQVMGRALKSGYIKEYVRETDAEECERLFAHNLVCYNLRKENHLQLALGILAGSDITPLLGDTVNASCLESVCNELTWRLQSKDANAEDLKRVTSFVSAVIKAKKTTIEKLRTFCDSKIALFSTTQFSKILNEVAAAEAASKHEAKLLLPSYKILIPAVAVVTLAVIVYKRLSKKQNTKNTVDADDEGIDEQVDTPDVQHDEIIR